MPKGLKTLIIILVISLVLFVGWKFIGGSSDSSSAGLTSALGSASSPAEEQVVSLLLRLQSIQLDGSFLTDPLFESLLETPIVIHEQPATRRDPFLPVGESGSRANPVDAHVTLTATDTATEEDQSAQPDQSATTTDQSSATSNGETE